MNLPRVLLVTDPEFGDDPIVACVRACAAALPHGGFAVQLRDKKRATASLRLFAARLREVTHRYGALLFVNGHPRIARDAGADGVHLGGASGRVQDARTAFGRSALVSVAVHDDGDAAKAVDQGADAALVSPIFPTRSGTAPGTSAAFGTRKTPRGVAALAAARRIVGKRGPFLYALGGVTAENARACARAGADGAAVVRGLLASGDPSRAARAIHDAFVTRW